MKAIKVAEMTRTGGVSRRTKIIKEKNPHFEWYKKSHVWKVLEEIEL